MSPFCAVAVLIMMAAEAEPPRRPVEDVSDSDRCLKIKIPAIPRMITNTINIQIQWRRFLADAGFGAGWVDAPECSGSNIGSDIFNSLRFFFASHKNVETCRAV